MDGNESYDAFRDTLGDMLHEINTLQGSILDYVAPDGKNHTCMLRFLLTGDNKFVHICQGIEKANAPYFCTYCPCSKAEIAEVSRDWPISRSLDKAQKAIDDVEVKQGAASPSNVDLSKLQRDKLLVVCGFLGIHKCTVWNKKALIKAIEKHNPEARASALREMTTLVAAKPPNAQIAPTYDAAFYDQLR